MHFTCYGQASGKQLYVNILSLLDGVVCVAGFSLLLTGFLGIYGIYIANVLNGVVTTLYIIGYAWFKHKRFPRRIEQLMVIPESFGADEEDRIDITVQKTSRKWFLFNAAQMPRIRPTIVPNKIAIPPIRKEFEIQAGSTDLIGTPL